MVLRIHAGRDEDERNYEGEEGILKDLGGAQPAASSLG